MILVLFLLLIPNLLFADVVSYNKNTGEVVAYIRNGSTGYESDPNVVTVNVAGNDIPYNQRSEYKFSIAENKFVLKTEAEKNAARNEIRKVQIRKEIRGLKNTLDSALKEKNEGFDVSVETTTIRTKIDLLKQEYQSLP